VPSYPEDTHGWGAGVAEDDYTPCRL